ncbi:MAG: hypothetical protein GX489_01035 [Firmicutes bacterium]|jgi:peptidoglycan glycosyltransferase|nr:hypothetical protein [Bacillota bacterium]
MRANVQRLQKVFICVFLLIVLALTNLTVFQRDKLMASPYNNQRVAGWDNQSIRGGIFDRHGEVLAVTDKKGGPRVYPAGYDLAPIIGYLDPKIGAAGLEARYGAELSGRPPFWAALGLNFPLAVQGEDLVLTVSLSLQREAMRLLAGRRGAAIVLDPRTGAVLALASQPSFEPSKLAKQWESISHDKAAPLLNRATQGLYPPGSTLKVVTLAAVLSQRPELAANNYHCPGQLTLPGYTVHCSQAHGELDLASALAVSCNVTFSQLGLKLGNNALAKQAERAFFNNDIPFELPTAKSSWPQQNVGDGETAQRAIGQGQVLTTPLQMALVTAGIANGGMIYQPYLVQERRLGGRISARTKPQKMAEFVSPKVAAAITDMMIEVTKHGTGRGAALSEIKVAGKTGTAENPHGAPHAWYIGFAPAEKPRVVVAVIVENAGSGAAAALPLARTLLQLALKEVS